MRSDFRLGIRLGFGVVEFAFWSGCGCFCLTPSGLLADLLQPLRISHHLVAGSENAHPGPVRGLVVK